MNRAPAVKPSLSNATPTARPRTTPTVRPPSGRGPVRIGRVVNNRPSAASREPGPGALADPWGLAGPSDTVIEGKDSFHDDRPSSRAALPLADMVDRASAQLSVLRRTLDEASSVSRRANAAAAEIARRADRGEQTCADLDERLTASATVLERATLALRGLEQLVGQIRTASSALESRVNARLVEHEAAFERRIAELQTAFESRIAEFEDGMESRLAAIDQQREIGAAELQRRIGRDSDRIGAEIDRRCAQVHARTSLLLDSASDRVATLDAQAAHVGGVIVSRVEDLCREAARVIGFDPRHTGPGELADRMVREGSLADRVAIARELVTQAEEASVRLASLIGETDSAAARARAAVEHTRESVHLASAAAQTLEDAAGSAIARRRSRRADKPGDPASQGPESAPPARD